MIKRLFVIAVLGVTVSGCFMAPLALIGPISSGFSTASLIQTGVTTGANYVVKKSTGKTIAEHVMQSLKKDIIKQSYVPENEPEKILKQSNQPKNKLSERCRKYDFYCKRKLNDNPALAKSLLPKIKINTGCKKRDYYCKRMSRKEWLQYINQNKSLLGSS